MSSISVPFHFISTFTVTVAALGGLWVVMARPEFVPSTRWMRRAFGAGFALLGLAELTHGARIAPSELEQSVVALRAGAYALFAGSLLPDRRGSKVTAAAAAPTGTALPMLLALPAAWFAFRNKLPAARRLAGAFGLFGVSEVVFQTCRCADAAVPGAMWLIGHGARLGAGVAIAAWLWQAIKTSIQARFIAIFMVLLLVVVAAISAAVSQVFATNVSTSALQRAASEGAIQSGRLDDMVRESLNVARVIAEQGSTRRLVSERDPALAAQIQSLQAPGGPFETYDFIGVVDAQGALLTVSAKGPNNTQVLDGADALSLAGTAVVQSVLQQQTQAGSLDNIGGRKIGAVVAFPVFNPPGFDPPGSPQGLAGAVLLGRVLDQSFLDALRREEEQEAFLVTRAAVLGRTSADPTGVLLTEATELDRLFDQAQIVNVRRSIGLAPVEYFASYIPLRRTDGEVVGALVIAQRSDVLERTQRDVGTTVFLVALFATFVAVAIAFLSGRRVTKPIRDLTLAVERVRGGTYEVDIPSATTDEVGVLADTFGEMTSSLAGLTTELRLKAEQEFQLRSQIEAILQSMADGVVAVDSDSCVVVVNREAERILDSKASELVGQPIGSVLGVKDAAGRKVSLPIYDLRSGSASGSVTSGRKRIPVMITCAPIKDERAEVIGGVAVLRDLTSEHQVEKMKTEFLSNISHELRTPLTPIMGYSELLRRKQVPRARAVTFLEAISASGKRLERIIEMLVDFSAMEAGRLVPKKGLVDLDEVTAELVRKWSAETKKHRFERRGFSRLPNVTVDPRLIPAAVGELIDNAVKFSPKGGKVVVVADSGVGRNGSGDLRISVMDQGIGITKEQLRVIGKDFVQVDASETRSYGGLGLGLAYVRRVVEAHGGSLEVESAPGKGSVFTLVLPASVRAKQGKPPDAVEKPRPSRRSPKAPIKTKRR